MSTMATMEKRLSALQQEVGKVRRELYGKRGIAPLLNSLNVAGLEAIFQNATPQSTPPTGKVDLVYLDDGSNTASGNTGWRRCVSVDPDVWEDLGLKIVAGTGITLSTTVNEERQITTADKEIDHDALLNYLAGEHFTEASIDHGSVGGLTDNDHPQYPLSYVSGSLQSGVVKCVGAVLFSAQSSKVVTLPHTYNAAATMVGDASGRTVNATVVRVAITSTSSITITTSASISGWLNWWTEGY